MLVTDQNQHILTGYFHSGTQIVYKKGELIIRPHETPEHIYYIQSGYVKAYSITKYGDENLHVIRHANEMFPLIWTFTEDHKDVAYEAIEETVVWRQSKSAYLEFLESNQNATIAVLGIAMRAYRTYAEHVNTLEYRTVRERVVSFLLACGRRFSEQTPEGHIRICAPLRQQDIASSINASRETTSRELGALSRKGLISISDRYVIILDPAKLQAML